MSFASWRLCICSFLSISTAWASKPLIINNLLYWIPFQTNLQYVSRIRQDRSIHQKGIDFEASPGYRIGVGIDQMPYEWDMAFLWTRFYNRSTSSAHGELIAPWEPEAMVRKASSVWRLQYDIVDIELGKQMRTIRPFMGIRAARIAQHIRSHYVDVQGSFEDLDFRAKNRYSGIGPRVGIRLTFGKAEGWSIFAQGAVSLLWGSYAWKWRYVGDHVLENQQVQYRVEGEAAMGLEWHRKHWTFGMSYEALQWWNRAHAGTLSLQGGTLSVRFHF